MSKQTPFTGIIAYPITPFTAAGAVDLDLYCQLVERLVASGSHGIAPLGSTGVLPYLTDAERDAVTTATIRQVAGRVPVLVGVSHLTTAGAVRHARFAEQAGATAIMVLPMSYWKLTEAEILTHYEQVAGAVAIPLMVYNNPATGGLDMSPALLQRLLEIPNVTMIKESTGDVQRMQALRRLLGKDVAFYNGSNPLALAAFAAGATGWCTAAPNLIPELNLALYEAIQANRLDRAQELFYRQFELLQFIVAKGLPRAIKAGLELQGLDAGHLRAPLLPLTAEETSELKRILESVAQESVAA
ncbi:dihydrodipicolinate synthase family protein [Hymenobacter sp. IS2118]|uniref:dihydrodipicolinate synthase family protein n=1 Tax=Hymenobacter sp. IS2118 TaxID=1505605 RepID=UPI0005598CD7|nr:dihydrodipicolinate synthase family protein [Hymenobacter sp. IS2118]